MRKYDLATEQNVRQAKMVREWAASGLLQPEQRDRMLADLTTNIRTTNPFFRLILLPFTALIIVASVLLVGALLGMRRDTATAALCVVAAAASILLAETLIGRFRLYRFGIEEALAILSAALLGTGTAFAVQGLGFSALAVTALAAWGIYLRFGYIGAAAGAIFSLSAIPFQLDLSGNAARFVSAGFLFIIWFVARQNRKPLGDEFPGDEFGIMEALSWTTAYAFLNLHAIPSSFQVLYWASQPESAFYWFTYATIWLLPSIGLYLAIREKHRLMLDANLCLALVTLLTNKPYLHEFRKPWDPILFGLVLVAGAVAIRRWVAQGENGLRNGFTIERVLSSERQKLNLVSTASVAFQPGGAAPQTSAPETFQPGGGRSGGAGASGSF